YGECVMGTTGTLVVETEQSAALWGIGGRSTEVTANVTAGRPVLDASSSTAPAERQAGAAGQNALGFAPVSRGYREEMEHLAYCIRKNPQLSEREREKPRCD